MNQFYQELLKLPKSIRQMGKKCIVGIEIKDLIYTNLIDKTEISTADSSTNEIKEFSIFLGSDAENIIQAFVDSDFSKNLEVLQIGVNSENTGHPLDYRKIAKILSEAAFPNLHTFSFGEWLLISNSHCLYGKLGDITQILSNMPKLNYLKLGGQFELNSPIILNHLTELIVNLDDPMTAGNGGYISQDTLNNLLNSKFPKLETVWLDLDLDWAVDDEFKRIDGLPTNCQDYKLTNDFIDGKSWSNLKQIEFSGGYAKGELDKFFNSQFVKNNQIKAIYDSAYS